MSCDNLPHNGAVTRKALLAFAALHNAELHDWIKVNVSFPNAMVDRITPMTSTAHRLQLHDEHGIADALLAAKRPLIIAGTSLGVIAIGVGGLEAESVMLGRASWMRLPEIVGVADRQVEPSG